MTKIRSAALLLAAAAIAAGPARAQDNAPTPVPVVTVSASATATVPNDRLHAWLRAEADNPSAAAASAEVNARVARVLAKLKSLPDAQVSTSGYTTQQIVEKGKPARWRVVQTIKVEGGDFAAIGEAAARRTRSRSRRSRRGARARSPRRRDSARPAGGRAASRSRPATADGPIR